MMNYMIKTKYEVQFAHIPKVIIKSFDKELNYLRKIENKLLQLAA